MNRENFAKPQPGIGSDSIESRVLVILRSSRRNLFLADRRGAPSAVGASLSRQCQALDLVRLVEVKDRGRRFPTLRGARGRIQRQPVRVLGMA